MTTFDGSTGAHVAPDRSQHYDNDFPPPAAPPLPAETPFDAFEALRESLAQRDEEVDRTTTVEVPGIGWRLVCAIDFEYGVYKNWQKAALPKSQRGGRNPNVLDMDQAVLAYLALFNTCEAIEYRINGGDWQPLIESDGQPATLQSSMLMNRMNVMDPRTLVGRMFGGDAALIRAGARVITAAGYAAFEDDAEDPTD
jgi:hypothetical protein